jgi:hypothetical protein
MECIRVMLTVFVIMGGVISSAPPVIAATENAYVRRNLVRTYACKTICCTGVGQTTSLSQRRWAGLQVAQPG